MEDLRGLEMKGARTTLLISLLIVGALSGASAGEPQSNTLLTSAKAIEFTRSLEERPLAPEARTMRSQLIDWAAETKDATITVCDVLGPIPGTDIPYGPELLIQSMFGNGSFQIEHPESKADELQAQLAGIKSMLRAYSNILKRDPSVRVPLYDTWLEKQSTGALQEALGSSITEKCVKSAAKA